MRHNHLVDINFYEFLREHTKKGFLVMRFNLIKFRSEFQINLQSSMKIFFVCAVDTLPYFIWLKDNKKQSP